MESNSAHNIVMFGEHERVKTKFFIDAEEYYRTICEIIPRAKRRVFIAGWFLSPEVNLVRSPNLINVENLLGRCPVPVYILLWNGWLMGLQPGRARSLLEKDNVHVKIAANGVLYTHHQKMVVIDDSFAFIGGLDLAFYRWDNARHELFVNNSLWPGKDFYNSWFELTAAFDHPYVDYRELKRGLHPRMPWHDVQILIVGSPAVDVARSFYERWMTASNWNRPANIAPPVICNDLDLSTFENFQEISTCRVIRTFEDDDSICKSYLDVIGNANDFIYIENQYFSTIDKGEKNLVVEKLKERMSLIPNLHVLVVLPMFPDNGKYNANVLKNQRCALERFKDENIKDRILFVSLFQLEEVNIENSKYITLLLGSQIYVHSKIMIADWNYGIVGSANLNLRSLCKRRDSEIGVYVQGEALRELQEKLWMEHLQIPFDFSGESSQLLGVWRRIATQRTKFLNKFENNIANDSIANKNQKGYAPWILKTEDIPDFIKHSRVCLLPEKYLVEEPTNANTLPYVAKLFE